MWSVNYEGWSNEGGLGRLINQWQDGPHVASGVGSEMGLRSCVVVEWAVARWVSPSRTLVLYHLLVSLYIAYSLLYRSLLPFSLSHLSIYLFFFIRFSIWTTGYTIFWICIFFKRFIWTGFMIHDFGGG